MQCENWRGVVLPPRPPFLYLLFLFTFLHHSSSTKKQPIEQFKQDFLIIFPLSNFVTPTKDPTQSKATWQRWSKTFLLVFSYDNIYLYSILACLEAFVTLEELSNSWNFIFIYISSSGLKYYNLGNTFLIYWITGALTHFFSKSETVFFSAFLKKVIRENFGTFLKKKENIFDFSKKKVVRKLFPNFFYSCLP